MSYMNNRRSPLLFGFYFKKRIDNLVIYSQKISLQNLDPILAMILRIFDLGYHSQSSPRVVMFDLVLMKFRKLKCRPRENKKMDLSKT